MTCTKNSTRITMSPQPPSSTSKSSNHRIVQLPSDKSIVALINHIPDFALASLKWRKHFEEISTLKCDHALVPFCAADEWPSSYCFLRGSHCTYKMKNDGLASADDISSKNKKIYGLAGVMWFTRLIMSINSASSIASSLSASTTTPIWQKWYN